MVETKYMKVSLNLAVKDRILSFLAIAPDVLKPVVCGDVVFFS